MELDQTNDKAFIILAKKWTIPDQKNNKNNSKMYNVLD